MTEEEIVLETVDYYYANPRSVLADNPGTCAYSGNEGARCAFSRCCTEAGLAVLSAFEGSSIDTVCSENPINHDDLLESKYRGHPLDFWNQLQTLHDSRDHWRVNRGGTLSHTGLFFVAGRWPALRSVLRARGYEEVGP